MFKKKIALLLAAVMLLSCCSCAASGKDSVLDKISSISGNTDLQALAINREPHVPFAPTEHSDVSFKDMSYHIYDTSEFLEKCDALATCQDVYEAIELYNWLYDEFITVETQYTICYIHYCMDVSDTTLQDDQVECEKIANDCWDGFCRAVRDCLKGPAGDDFTVFLGVEAAELYAEYEDMTDREKELIEEETRLVALYYEQLEETANCTYNYNGHDWTMDELLSSGFFSLSYDEVYEVYDGINANINAILGGIYLQLVQVRDEIAEINGYDSYADYAYENVFARDYTTADAQVFCDSVKADVGHEFFERMGSSSLLYSDFSYASDSEGLLDTVGEYARKLDSRFGEAMDYLKKNGLSYISDSPDMMDAGYTTRINRYNAPFIFVSLSGSMNDLGSVIHEFGHYCDMYWNQPGDEFLDSGCYDVFEIHSTGMEVMFQRFYPEIYGSRCDAAEFYTLHNLLYCVIDGCIFDEFQRTIYANPDMTLDEVNQLYYDLCVAYGQDEPTDSDYWWMYVPHNFESPMYYISYAVSALASLQLWNMQQEDAAAALDMYIDIVGWGAYEYGYLELIEAVGLKSFAQEGAAAQICQPVMHYCEQLG